MVIRDLCLIDGSFAHRQFSAGQRTRNKLLVGFRQQLHGLYYPRYHIRRKKPAVCTWISQRLVFLVQALGRFQRFIRGKAQHAVCVPLQAGQVIQLRRKLLLPGGFSLDYGTCLILHFRGNLFRVFFFFQVGIRIQFIGKVYAAVITEIGGQCAEPFRLEVFNFLPAFHQDRQRRRLYTADGKERIVFQCKCPAGIHPYQPVCLAPAPGTFIQPVIVRSRPDIPESFRNGFICHR